MPALNDAIEHLYVAFASVPKPKHIDGCPHCIAEKKTDILLSKPLRELTPDDLTRYAFSAFLTVGDKADYLYFLPRILEFTATENCWIPGPEMTARAILTAQPETWTADQRRALNDYIEALMDSVIQSTERYRIDGLMSAIARLGYEVQPYLDRIARCPAAVLDYFESNAESLPRNKLASWFRELPCPAHDAIVEWFFSPEIAKVPFDAYSCTLIRST